MGTAMKSDLDVSGYQPDLVAGKDGRQIIVRCEIIDQIATGPRRSGKYIHLDLTAADAMQLLSRLQAAQKQFGWPVPQTTVISVPPAADRN